MFTQKHSLSLLLRIPAVCLPALMAGCASYYSHYAVFPAANSGGEPRQVRVSWQSAEYPGWALFDDKATPVTVVTQCSQRTWRLTDASHSDPQGQCGDGIRACGEQGLDRLGDRAADANAVCMAISGGGQAAQVAELGGRIELTVSCRPEQPQRVVQGEAENVDYIRPSSVPYVIDVRKAPRGSLAGRLPELDDAICKQ